MGNETTNVKEETVRRSFDLLSDNDKKPQIHHDTESLTFTDNRPLAANQAQMKKVIQRVPFGQFIYNMKQDKTPKDLILYTHVLTDGSGDIGMLNNLAGIMSNYMPSLHIINILKYATVEWGEKPRIDKVQNFDQKKELDFGSNVNPARKTRNSLPPRQEEQWEIQGPVPDADYQQDFNTNRRVTALSEMGHVIENTSTTIKIKKGEETGMITPYKEEIDRSDLNLDEQKCIGEILAWLGANPETAKPGESFIPPVAIINVRQKNKSKEKFRPDLGFIITWLNAHGIPKALVLGEDENERYGKDTQIYAIPSLPSRVLKFIIEHLHPDGLVIAGGEALFSEGLGLGSANTVFAARYKYQPDALKSYAKRTQSETGIDLGKLELEFANLNDLVTQNLASLSTNFSEMRKLTGHLRRNNIHSFIDKFIRVVAEPQQPKTD